MTAKNKLHFVIVVSLMIFMIAISPVSSYELENQKNIVGVTATAPILVDMDKIRATSSTIKDGLWISDTVEYISYWNERLGWSLSEKQIGIYAEAVNGKLSAGDLQTGGYKIDNISDLGKLIGEIMDLTPVQIDIFVAEQREQLAQDRIQALHASSRDYSLPPLKTRTVPETVSPDSRSAPYALGNLVYIYVFVDFEVPSSDGPWTDSHGIDAIVDATTGVLQIQNQAPAAAGVTTQTGYFGPVTVSGSNTGDNEYAWGVNGWMERAIQAHGYADSNGDGRYTDDAARELKSVFNGDSLMFLFFTHDDKGAYAFGQDQGYTDRAAVSYWGKTTANPVVATPNSYMHEALHAYGALDEYNGSSRPGMESGLAVSPMRNLYKNTNHEDDIDNHTHSIMCSGMYGTYTISTSTRNFIGWGDYDSDGILDPVDPTPKGMVLIVDEDLRFGNDIIVTGGGYGIWPDSPSGPISGDYPAFLMSQDSWNSSVPDLSSYVIRYYYFGGVRYEFGSDDVPIIPNGTIRVSNMDIDFQWRIDGLSEEPVEPYIYFGLGPYPGYVSWPLYIEDPGFVQHITVGNISFVDSQSQYGVFLERFGITSTINISQQNALGDWNLYISDTSSFDFYQKSPMFISSLPQRVDITCNGEIRTVYWQGDNSTPSP